MCCVLAKLLKLKNSREKIKKKSSFFKCFAFFLIKKSKAFKKGFRIVNGLV
jgi:hypothetical protein